MNLIDWVGSVAAILTTASFVPQAWHTFRTHDVSGISLSMYSLFTAGVALWLVYGILMEAWPIIIATIDGDRHDGSMRKYKSNGLAAT